MVRISTVERNLKKLEGISVTNLRLPLARPLRKSLMINCGNLTWNTMYYVGEYSINLLYCGWELWQNESLLCKSLDSRNEIEPKINILENQKILGIKVNYGTLNSKLLFTNNIHIEILYKLGLTKKNWSIAYPNGKLLCFGPYERFWYEANYDKVPSWAKIIENYSG